MPNHYNLISPQEQSLYESFVNQVAEKEKQKHDDLWRMGEYYALDAALRKDIAPRISNDQKKYLGSKVSFSQENINGRDVNVGRVNNPGDFHKGSRGYYTPARDYIVAPRGTPFLRGSQESAQKTLDHETVHASRRDAIVKGYDKSKRWEERPEEIYAEAGALEKFKQRLQAMGIEYTSDMGMRYLMDFQGDQDIRSNKVPVKGNYGYLPANKPVVLSGQNSEDPLSPTNRNQREVLTNPANRLKDIIDQREAFYNGGKLPPLEVFDPEYRATTDAYRRPLMSAQIAYNQHPLLTGSK